MSPGHVSAASIQPDTNEVKARLASLNAAAVLSGEGGGGSPTPQSCPVPEAMGRFTVLGW